jgi:predicted MFS family arabinose efflux permease
MTTAAATLDPARLEEQNNSRVFVRTLVIGLTAFLTVVDLFATQAILPTLTRAYGVTPAAMGFAVNSCTLGMAGAGLLVSLFSRRIERRSGILISLASLSIPTALLSVAPDDHLYRAARHARALHGIRIHPDAGLSGRGVQCRRCRRRLCGLYHRQCR